MCWDTVAFAVGHGGRGAIVFGLPTGYALAAGMAVYLLADAMEPGGVPESVVATVS
jgi:hypothetical protein